MCYFDAHVQCQRHISEGYATNFYMTKLRLGGDATILYAHSRLCNPRNKIAAFSWAVGELEK